MRFRRLTGLFLLAALLGACGRQSVGDPADAVRHYLTAKAAGDAEGVRRGLCSALEADLERETLAFKDLNARLESMACAAGSGPNTVACSGEILVDYGGEEQAFPLSTYTVVQEDGAWKWCGEAP